MSKSLHRNCPQKIKSRRKKIKSAEFRSYVSQSLFLFFLILIHTMRQRNAFNRDLLSDTNEIHPKLRFNFNEMQSYLFLRSTNKNHCEEFFPFPNNFYTLHFALINDDSCMIFTIYGAFFACIYIFYVSPRPLAHSILKKIIPF